MSARVCERVAARRCVVITMEGDCAGTADLRTRPGELHEEDDRACSRPAYGRHCCTARRPEHAGQAASDADDVKVPNTDFTTVLCTRMSSIGPPSFRESNRTARRHGGFMKPLDQLCLWKRLVALYKKLVYCVARVGRWDA